jgi:hypothetical protein
MNSYSLCKHSFWLYDWIKCFSENFFFLNHPLLESNSSASIYNQTSFSHCLVSMVFVVGALNKNLLKPLDPIKADLVGMVLVFSTLYQTDPLSWDDTWVVPFQLCIRQTRPPSKTKKESYYKQIYLWLLLLSFIP